MDLIIKPTEACNFHCSFCSSSAISDIHTTRLDTSRIFEFITRFPRTNTIIVNGGDPLMVNPKYYWDIIEFLDTGGYKASISLTSNLGLFVSHPNKWVELFKHPRVGVTTSFNYGPGRVKEDHTLFTESDFIATSDAMLELVGYRPDFISVITTENESTAIDNVKLAQRLGVECKLNYAMASGNQGIPYQLSKIYEIYVQIYALGLSDYEYNTRQLIQTMNSQPTTCPQSRDCDKHIRALNPGGDYYSCGAFGDDKKHAISFSAEMSSPNTFSPLSAPSVPQHIKPECYSCELFNICNGCKKTVSDMIQHDMVDDHCKLMKSLQPAILSMRQHV